MQGEFHGSDIARARVVHWFNFHKAQGVEDISLGDTFITWFGYVPAGWSAMIETNGEDGLLYSVQYDAVLDETILKVYFEQFNMRIESIKPNAPIQDELPFNDK